MGKVTVIQKSRKAYICQRCGKTISVGSKYYRGDLNFASPIIRCNDCGLESWEVTTSEYQLNVGNLLYRWEENFGCNEDTISEVVSELSIVKDSCQDSLDNIPENLQYSQVGETLQERIDSIDAAIDMLECVDIDEIKNDVICNVLTGLDLYDETREYDYDELLSEYADQPIETELIKSLENAISDIIEEALENITF